MADADTRQQALQAGADDVLVKPFERAELLDRLEQPLARRQRGAQETRSPRT